MSFDKDTVAKSGITISTAALTTAAVTDADLADGNMENASCAHVQIDTTAGDVDIDAAALTALDALTGIGEGDKFAFIKSSTDANLITFTDPVSGFVYDFVNRQSESICIVKDGANWIFNP